MKYVMCKECGKRLFRGEPGTKVEIECPKCGKHVSVIIAHNDLRIIDKQIEDTKMRA